MRIAIASDIHGNKHAFEAVIEAAENAEADELWCLGDLVGYGGDPDASVALAMGHARIGRAATTAWRAAAGPPPGAFRPGGRSPPRGPKGPFRPRRAGSRPPPPPGGGAGGAAP